MDGGPFSASGNNDHSRFPSRQESIANKVFANEPQNPPKASTAPIPTRHSLTVAKEKKFNFKKWLIIIILVSVVILLGLIGWVFFNKKDNSSLTGIDSSKYQAVFLNGGQIYFGKLASFNNDYYVLSNGYYPQVKADGSTVKKDTENLDQQNSIQLIPLSDEVYGPENKIYITKKQILHYENLKSDSKVTELITKNQSK